MTRIRIEAVAVAFVCWGVGKVVCGESITMEVPPLSTECVGATVKVPSGERIVDIEWMVVRGGLLDIHVRMTVNDVILYNRMHFEGQDMGKRTLTLDQDSTISVCFGNTMARFTSKVVRLTSNAKDEDPENLSPETEELHGVTRKVCDSVDRLLESILKQKAPQSLEFFNAISLGRKVTFFGAVLTTAIVVFSVVQVYAIKSFFSFK
ncbi:hypothetical protein Pelo_12677 [Pelomyxa schiedti]|nr:hypothetical protein Pelo_12677 [Pelomyxa schiedti]